MRKTIILGGLLLASSAAFYVFAGSHQQATHHGNHGSPSTQESVSPSIAAYQSINDQMHSAMSIEFTGDADIDFVRGMIPHHEGAVEMAKVVLAHGSDPEIRALAEAVVKAQEEEIEMMYRWLAERGLNEPK